jgi:holo-[acyl-carrier protein] synthase
VTLSTASAPRLSVGVDLASVPDVRRAVDEFGARYLQRVFTAQEIAACQGSDDVRASGLAGRFAAKEAVFKALRVEDPRPPWTDVEITRTPAGWPRVDLYGSALLAAERMGAVDISLSLSHESDHAVAVVALTCVPPVAPTDVAEGENGG